MRHVQTLLLTTSIIAVGAPALAQSGQAAPDQPTRVEEIVITGVPYGVTRRATTLALEVLDEEELATAPPATLGDVVNGLPGVRSTSFAAGASRPVIRGLAGPRVLVLNNGVGLIDASALSPDHQVAADPADASRIEILRGPSTLAYGGTAIGGVVNVIDDRIPEEAPEGGFDGRLSAQTTSVDDGWAVGGGLAAVAGPLVFTLEGQRREAGDYDIPAPAESRRQLEAEGEELESLKGTTLENSFSNLSTYGGGVSWIGGNGFVGLSVRRTESDYGVPGHAHHHEEDEDHDDAPLFAPGDEEEEAVTIDLVQTRYDVRGGWDLNWGPFERLRITGGFADYQHTEFEGDQVGTQFLSEGWEGRAELVQAPQDGWRGAVGVQALRRDLDAVGDEAYVPQTQVTEFGAFALQRLDRGRFGVEGGLRLDSRELDSVAGQRDFSNVSGSLGLFFRPTPDWFVGVSVARNGRAPTEAELFADGPHVATRAYEVGDASLDSETVTSLEGTLHFDRGPFSLDLHLFHARYDGFIDLRPTGAEEDELPVFAYVQTDAEFSGFEAETAYRLWDEGERRTLDLELAADYVRGSTDLGPPARIPPWSIAARAEMALDSWTGRLELREVGEQDRVTDFELPTDGYRTLNAFLSWAPDPEQGLLIYVEGRNLNDAEIREHASFLKDLAPSPGRNVRVGVVYRF
ncbi:TonB-dependent receptor [Brevundimonas sp.]|uniref:TonB-dependent receptor domain-containing protein n=1 Tax=Brevundimonas sp. TaxID=1871086 RepID=UPI0025FD5B04|nr:TonB-dependent receptor [Brevundimonas sp.]